MLNLNLTDRCMLRLNMLILLQGVINVRLPTDIVCLTFTGRGINLSSFVLISP
jgi:hypothetical protein